MGVTQTDYARTMERGYVGDKATAAKERTDSYIVEDADGLPYGVAAMRGTADDGCVPGADHIGQLLGALNANINDSATALVFAAAVDDYQQYLGSLIQIGHEIMLVTAQADATNWTVERGASGSTALSHNANEAIRATSRERFATHYLGIARTDRAKTSPQSDRYVQGRVAGVMNMGDIFVRVLDAVEGGDSAMVRIADGRVTKRTLPVPVEFASIDAFFDDSAASGGVATLCLQGEQGRAQN